jgi:LAO/AO transport system kinase
MKAGLMEVADIFVVNKCDRPEADIFVQGLHQLIKPYGTGFHQQVPVVKTVAISSEGVDELYQKISRTLELPASNHRKLLLLSEQAYLLIQKKRMIGISKQMLIETIKKRMLEPGFNIYRLADEY